MESPQSPPQLSGRPEHVRSKSAFSFRSHKSSGSNDKVKISDLKETEGERRRNKFSGKGFHNPNRAMQEAEPAARAQEHTTISSFRGIQHKDWQGNPITDPDSSNPARSRLERPLDTIRSFEAAAEGSRQRKQQASRTAESVANFGDSSRRGSVIGTDSFQRDPSYDPSTRAPPSAYSTYSRRGMGQRMSSAPSMDRPYNQGQNGYNSYNGHYGHNGHNGHDGLHGQNGYPYHGHNDSFDTNGDSTGSPSEPWANSTDPSSENSSIDRIHAYNKQADTAGDAYGGAYQNGPGYPNGAVQHGGNSPKHNGPMRQRQPIAEESWDEDRGLEGEYDYQGAPHQAGRPYQQPTVNGRDSGMRGPPPPGHMQQQPQRGPQPTSPGAQGLFPRKVIPLGGENRPIPTAAPGQQYNQPQAQTGRPKTLEKRPSEKRKSWIKRRFSKD